MARTAARKISVDTSPTAEFAAALKRSPAPLHAYKTAKIELFDIAPENPRTIRRPEDVDALAQNITTHGVLEPLICYPAGSRLMVTVGGTRLLSARKARLPDLPYALLPREEAIAAGLAEQEGHTPLHAADQARAYAAELARLNGEGPITREAAIKTIANRVGRTPRFVAQRIALASLHPPILAALGHDKIDLPIAAAWANAPLDRQAKTWNTNHQLRDVRAIKQALARGRLAANDNLVKFVSLKAYREAGGELVEDLFSFAGDHGRAAETIDDAGKQGVFIADSGLVTRLAREKLQRAATAREKEGWGFVEFGMSDFPAAKYERVNAEPKDKAGRAKLGLWITIEKWDHKIQATVIRKNPEEKAAAKSAKPVGGSSQQVRAISYEAEREFDNVADVLAGRAIAENPKLAVALIAADMARNMLKGLKGSSSLVGEYYLPGERMKPGLATDAAWAAKVAAWENELAPHDGQLVEYLDTLPPARLFDLLALGVGFFLSSNETETTLHAAVRMSGLLAGEHWSPTEKQLKGLSPLELDRCARELGLTPSAKPADTTKQVAAAAKTARWYPRFVRERLGIPDPEPPPTLAESIDKIAAAVNAAAKPKKPAKARK